jgi:hypothetical protein
MKTFKAPEKIIFAAIGLFFLFSVAGVKAVGVGDIVNFNVDKSFDASGRMQMSATLVKISGKLYFYIEKSWWDSQTSAKQTAILGDLGNLSDEFDSNIYPKLTSSFGSEWNPGIDKDSRITVLFESMNSTEGGYFREADEYEKIQLPSSNEREMLYLSVSSIENPDVKIVLGHEFTHLITFNQKNKIFGSEDDTWLNEARADYSSTILGYDNLYNGSNLQQRVKDFVENPSDSITDWTGTKYDYASVDLFTHYLVDHYGVGVLSGSLKSKSVGIESINNALSTIGARENFSQIFTDWTVALVVNDCSQSQNYCYLNQNLNSLRVSPTLIFLPLTGDSSLSATNVTKNWSGNWQKIIGGSGSLKLDFSSLAGLNFQVPYIIYDKSGGYTVKLLAPDKDGKGEISIDNFGVNYKSLVIIPSLQTKISGFDYSDLIYPFSFTVSITGNTPAPDQALMQKLLDQITSLKKQIADILAQKSGSIISQPAACSQIAGNLSLGSTGAAVSCLQQFLKNQGTNIYPEGLVTGNFGSLTKAAVIKLQVKYAIPQTGFVGPLTRNKINQILNGG